eukprot:CAMPEP_0172633646 /NCGR_PEP_ID=MMETSP1068-20121228/190480_1 /TAXON_ID=35684 /ORGANISM="Pseudopedinella elastica, Strain CCMP716" /LENGTH=328 /DNA_ID=CAMNT_0013445397 /DNA_START=238 /DNA_END=1220 /DNA_ORIENTATION=+
MAKDDATGKHKSNGPLTGLLSQLGVARHPIVVLIREKFCTFEGCWMCIANLIVIACRLLASVLCCLGPLVALSWVAGWPFRLPVELFFWPQSASLGGAGFPPPEPYPTALLLDRCPKNARRDRAAGASFPPSASLWAHTDPPPGPPGPPVGGSGGLEAFGSGEPSPPSSSSSGLWSLRQASRVVVRDLPCLNASHLDAGVCVAAKDKATMRCLPSFLVIGAQKAGSTDLRGLLSFHPYLDGPSSEVRFFTHLGGDLSTAKRELELRWREYLAWFPEWPLPLEIKRGGLIAGGGAGLLGSLRGKGGAGAAAKAQGGGGHPAGSPAGSPA